MTEHSLTSAHGARFWGGDSHIWLILSGCHIRHCVGAIRHCVGAIRHCVGDIRHCVGDIRRCIGDIIAIRSIIIDVVIIVIVVPSMRMLLLSVGLQITSKQPDVSRTMEAFRNWQV